MENSRNTNSVENSKKKNNKIANYNLIENVNEQRMEGKKILHSIGTYVADEI